MRKCIVSITVCLVLSLFAGQSSADRDWYTTIVDDVGNVGEWTSIALDFQDQPHISYFDNTNANLEYAHYDGSSWQICWPDTEGDVGRYSSIALDGLGYPHIAYFNVSHEDLTSSLKYTYYDGETWQIVSVETSSENVGLFCSIAIDSYDRPHISYFADLSLYDLKYSYYYGFDWYIITVDETGMVGRFTSIALDAYDRAHISYQDFESGNGNLKYAYYDGVIWDVVDVDTAGDVGYYTSIAVDRSGYPHISYRDNTNRDLKYAYYDGAHWTIVIVDSAGDVGKFDSIALDSTDRPHISYYAERDLRDAYFDGVTWHITTIDTGGVGRYSSIALDSDGYPHISYRDDTNDALKYAWYGSPLSIDLVSFTARAEVGGVVLDWSVEATEGETITGFNLYRRELCASQPNTLDGDGLSTGLGWCKVNDSLIVGANPYSYTDGDVEGFKPK